MPDEKFLEDLDSILEQHPDMIEEVLVEAPELLDEFNKNFSLTGRSCKRTAKNPRNGKVYCIEWSDE